MENINIGWEFQKLPQADIREIKEGAFFPIDENQFIQVNLPHTWYEDGAGYKGTVIYRKKVRLACEDFKRVFIQFGAADRWCKVFINGHYAGEHKGGYSAFAFEISQYWELEEENEISVFLDNQAWDEISPLTGDFTVFGGLYRDVTVMMTDSVCFDRTYYGTSGVIVKADVAADGTGTVSVEPHILGAPVETADAVCRISSPEHQTAATWAGGVANLGDIRVDNPVLWDGKRQAALYHLHMELQVEGKTVDSLDIPFGFRDISIDSQDGFFLNGNHVKINGVAKHQDTAGVFHATGQQQWQQDMDDIMEIGANSVRLSHYQHPQEMYDLCDEKGLIVWAEIPMMKMTDSKALFDNACNQLRELILQNMHHPSICFWGIQNEIAMFGENELMVQRIKEMDALVKSLDSTRISACANLFCVKNESPLNRITAAVGYNIYFGWYYGEMKDNGEFAESFHRENPDIPLGITEYGVDCNLAFHSEEPKVKDYSEEYQALYHETVYPMFRDRAYIWGTYVWNLYDFSSEIREEGRIKYKNGKGLISYNRESKKDAFYYYKAQWSSEPFVKIAQSRFVNRAQPEITVKVYSNQKKVTLSVNGKTYTQNSDDGIFLFAEIRLNKGENMVRATSGECMDEAVFCGVEQPDPSYAFVDPNPGLNVKNWFIDEVEEEKMFPKGKLSIRESCTTLLGNEEAMAVIGTLLPELAKQMKERQSPMPLERILSYMKNQISEEQCKTLNERLTKIENE